MLFNSLHFLFFFPIVVIAYFLLAHKYRWILLLSASYYFYMCWRPEYIILIIISTLIDYLCGLKMGEIAEKVKRRKYLLLSLFTNLGLLFAFKYFNFFNDSLRAGFNHFNIFYNVPAFKLLLPLGISFYTFQTLSYSIDVYRGHQKPQKHLGKFALFVAFFPQLVAGPIERSLNLLPQFDLKHSFDYNRVKNGLLLMGWGFFKKIVIADHVAIIVNQIYNSPTEYTGVPLLLATYFFAFQIYCDFSGYSDIAIGAAEVMGFRLMKNFKTPYCSQSIGEFWKRWHISLSTWFKDYLYIPLGGNKCSQFRCLTNIIIVFLVSGLWHGANWTFVVWGGLHGLYFIFSMLTKNTRAVLSAFFKLDKIPKIHKAIKIFTTFHLVVFSWIFFRANSLSDALYIVKNIFVDLTLKMGGYGMKLDIDQTVTTLLFIFLLEGLQYVQRRESLRDLISRQHITLRWPAYYLLIFSILIFGRLESELEFIYFQF